MANETVGKMKDRAAANTGGSRGLGRNTARHLAGRGVNVIFTYRSNQKQADSLIREVEAMGRKAAGFRLDTGDVHAFDGFVADVRKMLHGWGRDRFDYLVNNAGGSLHTNFEQTTQASSRGGHQYSRVAQRLPISDNYAQTGAWPPPRAAFAAQLPACRVSWHDR
jgi:NAD(P)-dependent dehydrogenase (short-subunit alcohol dehydrogenase family)